MPTEATSPPSSGGAQTTGSSDNTGSAGKISRYMHNWKNITSNSFILRIVQEGYKIQFVGNPVFPPSVISYSHSLKKTLGLRQQIHRLLDSGAISKATPNTNQVLSRVFTVEKSNGSLRMILDLSRINTQIQKISFKMETLDFIKDLLNPSDYMISLDLSDAFFTVPVHESSKDYLCFKFDNQIYQYNVLPFGMTSSPRIFSKILRVPILHLRNLGIRISSYLDDIFICNSCPTTLVSQLNTTISLLTSLGFTPNYEKSKLIPSFSLIHLGFNWDSLTMKVSVPTEKIIKVRSAASFLTTSPASLRSLSSFIGLVNSLCPAFPLAPLRFRNLQFLLARYVRTNRPWDSEIHLDTASIQDLNWWSSCEFVLPGTNIRSPKHDLTMSTDASTTGWGAVLSTGESTSGIWPVDQSLHINILELEAIKLGIEYFLPKLSNKHFLLYCDNFTAVSFMNKKGGTHSKPLCSLSLEIWSILSTHNISCESIHIPGSENCEADFHSRIVSFSNEYCISRDGFDSLLLNVNFSPTLDLFASQSNFRLPKFVSWHYDPNAYKTNAFSFKWPNQVYLFPPINLIAKCIHKLIADEVHQALLITPAWPGLVSMPTIQSMLIDKPVFIPYSFLEGPLPTRRRFHMMGWPISSHRVYQEAYQLKLVLPSSTALKLPLSKHTVVPGENFILSLKKKGHTVILL